ncbi:hypothetical protein [Sinorhizobium medicae]|uniref:hypothetical protein n=1 Tax=Sinorhizobium medicae TaxID=110321 RepID=UPI000FD96B62|nr:hypothetical protein [Sinorhizobium medicae]RVP50002.1 hypothetical protein CN078_21420 [Sinorhizobium medicae]RVP74879.1 hypothetical protein CN079_21130 [Sinorhizobium medicae]UWU09390.1 hypothetical protein N2598_06510 [Sinorhizobium medicae]
MIEKITHIRNPLTVIAVFAGLAEVSGTVVLPFLSPETQKIYVDFLMFFPILLVVLFFAVLYWKHHVLYAPSDYRTDETFTAMFVAATPFARIRKYEGEVEDITLGAPISVEVDGALSPLIESPAPAPQSEPTDAPIMSSAAKRLGVMNAKSVFTDLFVVEELAVAQMEKQTNLKFERNVSPNGMPGVVFDGVWTDGVKTVVLDITYVGSSKAISALRIAQRFLAVNRYVKQLPKIHQDHFDFLAVFVLEEYSSEAANKVTQIGADVSAKYPFKSSIHALNASFLRSSLSSSDLGIFG